MQNDMLDEVASNSLKAVEIIKANPIEEEKNYILLFLHFFRNEVGELRQPFRRLFKKYGCTVGLRKYFIAGADGVKIEYEARFIRFGYHIVCRADNIPELKRKFIAEVNSKIVGVQNDKTKNQ